MKTRILQAAAMAVLLFAPISATADNEPPYPSGNYVDPSDLNIYYYDNLDDSLTYVGPCDDASCTGTEGNNEGQCSFVNGAWNTPSSIYSGLGACAKADAIHSGTTWARGRRVAVTEVSVSATYQYRVDWTWSNIFAQPIGTGSTGIQTLCQALVVARCDTLYQQVTMTPPVGTFTLTVSTKLYKDAVFYRSSTDITG